MGKSRTHIFIRMEKRKITLITTSRNEEQTITAFLSSIERQSFCPDELVIVDAYSTDRTVERIREFEKNSILSIRLIQKRGNRSYGRNAAVREAKNEIIACSDVGCILDTHWLEKITQPFEDDTVDVVAGFYYPKTKNTFELCLAAYTCVMKDKVDPDNFLPSSRSIAFRRSAWKKVGGYPQWLEYCEDLVFAKKLSQHGARFVTVLEAVVYWPQRSTIWAAARQFFRYAQGDGQARYFRPQTPFLFIRYLLGLVIVIIAWYVQSIDVIIFLIFGILLYLLWAIVKNYRYVRCDGAYIYLPLLQIVSDIAVISGTIVGLLQSIWGTLDKR